MLRLEASVQGGPIGMPARQPGQVHGTVRASRTRFARQFAVPSTGIMMSISAATGGRPDI